MDVNRLLTPQNELQFLVSLLRVTHPGEPAPEQTQLLEELLAGKTTR
jgi:hypothetical protein